MEIELLNEIKSLNSKLDIIINILKDRSFNTSTSKFASNTENRGNDIRRQVKEQIEKARQDARQNTWSSG